MLCTISSLGGLISLFFKCLFVILLVDFCLYFDGKSEQIDKARCVRLVIHVIFAERCNLFGIKRIITPRARLDDIAFIKLHNGFESLDEEDFPEVANQMFLRQACATIDEESFFLYRFLGGDEVCVDQSH